MLAEKEIVWLYVEKKLSGREVARRTNISLWKVQQILREHGAARSLSDAQKRLYENGYQHPFKTQLNAAEVIHGFLEEGKSLPFLAKEYGCSVTPLKRILRENGIPIRQKINENHVIELYVKKSLSGRKISQRTGYSLGTVQTVLKKHNVARNLKEARASLFQKGYKHPSKKELNKDLVIELYTKENVSIPKIAKLFNCSLAPILRILTENNIPTKSPTISHLGNPGYWKGKKRPDMSIKLKGQKRSEKTKEIKRKQRLQQKFPTEHTLPERMIFEELQRRGILFEKHQTLFNQFQPDAVIEEKKIAIFADGDYWHANPAKYKDRPLTKQQIDRTARDAKQHKILKEGGWTVLRFWESDIKRDISACGNEIEKALKDR